MADARALFYNKTHGYEVFELNTKDPTQSFIVNAPRAEGYGAELDLSAQPIKSLDVTLSLLRANWGVERGPRPPNGSAVQPTGASTRLRHDACELQSARRLGRRAGERRPVGCNG